MVIIRAEGLVKSYGAQVVLNHLDVELQEKDRIGIIGRNGAGKTTLFKLLAGLESPDSGQLNIKRGLKIGYLAQMPEVQAHQTGMAVLKEAFEPLYKIEREMTQLGHELSHTNDKNAAAQLTEKLASLQEQFEWSGGYEIDQKIKRVCDGLGIKETLLSQCFEQMSGGEKTRMMLGRILLEAPDVLLLDEPTNHLDLEALTWLEGYLRQYNGAVLIVSHDREFLDQTVTQILSVEDGTAKLWQGNYTLYKQAYDSWLFNQMAIYKQQQKKIRAMEEAIRRFEDWGKRSDDPAMFAKARNMQKRIEKMDKIDKPGANDKAMGLTFKSDGRTGHLVFVLKNVTGGYDHQRLFNQLDLEVKYQDNAVLMGANGSGKTTLFQMLRGKMSPEAGTVTIGSNVKLGYLEQEVSFENEQMTVFEYFNDQTMIGEFVARGKLARFMFFTEDLTKPLQALSGGERVRLKLCLMMELGINVLLLDEPTNHMDIASREVLEMALESFKGTILMISHDRYFVKKLADRLMFLEDGKIRIFEGTYEDWQSAEPTAQAKIETNRAEAIEGLKHDIAMASRHIDPLQRSRQNELRKAKQRLEVINPQLESLQRDLEAVMEALSSMEQPYEKLMALTQQQEALEHQIEALGLEWLELTELLEL